MLRYCLDISNSAKAIISERRENVNIFIEKVFKNTERGVVGICQDKLTAFSADTE